MRVSICISSMQSSKPVTCFTCTEISVGVHDLYTIIVHLLHPSITQLEERETVIGNMDL